MIFFPFFSNFFILAKINRLISGEWEYDTEYILSTGLHQAFHTGKCWDEPGKRLRSGSQWELVGFLPDASGRGAWLTYKKRANGDETN